MSSSDVVFGLPGCVPWRPYLGSSLGPRLLALSSHVDTWSALAPPFSREDADAFDAVPTRKLKTVRQTANAAIKYLRKQFTTSTGKPVVDQIDLTNEECFVCPPFKRPSSEKGPEGIIDIDAIPSVSFRWKEFLARAFPPSALAEILAQPVYRVTIEHTGEKGLLRHFVDRDAQSWELRFWRTDRQVVRCRVVRWGNMVNFKIEEDQDGKLTESGPAQRERRWVGSHEVRPVDWQKFGGMVDESFLINLERRVRLETNFNIKISLAPDAYWMPIRVKTLLYKLSIKPPPDEPAQSALAASEYVGEEPAYIVFPSQLFSSSSDQVGDATQEAPAQPAAAGNSLTQPAPAANSWEDDGNGWWISGDWGEDWRAIRAPQSPQHVAAWWQSRSSVAEAWNWNCDRWSWHAWQEPWVLRYGRHSVRRR